MSGSFFVGARNGLVLVSPFWAVVVGLAAWWPVVTLTSLLFRAARLSASGRAVRRGPKATAKRLVRIGVGRAYARSGIPRWPS